MNTLTMRLQHFGHRMLCQPIDLQVGAELTQFVGNGNVTLCMPQPNGRGDIECAFAAIAPTRPGQRWWRGAHSLMLLCRL